MDEEERESLIVAQARTIIARRNGLARAQMLSPERRREIASAAGRAAAERMSPEARRERARYAAQARWSGVAAGRIMAKLAEKPR